MYVDENDRPPGLDERYIAATNSSNLRLNLNPDAQCDATHLIAAGLLGNRMGEALAHLRAEWDSAEKPRKATEAEILARAAQLPKRKGKVDVKRARIEAMVAHAAAMRKRAEQLRGRAQVLGLMREWAAMRDVDPDLLSPALYHWLHPTCPACEGRGKMLIADTPVLGKDCNHCAGAGKWPRPLGAERVDDWLKGCAGRAKRDRASLLNAE